MSARSLSNMIKKLRSLTLVKNSLRTIAISDGVQRVHYSASLECPRGATTGRGFKRATRWASRTTTMAASGQMGRKPPIEIGVCRARPFVLLFANQCSPIALFAITPLY